MGFHDCTFYSKEYEEILVRWFGFFLKLLSGFFFSLIRFCFLGLCITLGGGSVPLQNLAKEYFIVVPSLPRRKGILLWNFWLRALVGFFIHLRTFLFFSTYVFTYLGSLYGASQQSTRMVFCQNQKYKYRKAGRHTHVSVLLFCALDLMIYLLC